VHQDYCSHWLSRSRPLPAHSRPLSSGACSPLATYTTRAAWTSVPIRTPTSDSSCDGTRTGLLSGRNLDSWAGLPAGYV
jgi:hypothetical protein